MNGFNNGESYKKGEIVTQKVKDKVIMHMIMRVLDNKYVLACHASLKKKRESISIETTNKTVYINPTKIYKMKIKDINKTSIYVINSCKVVSEAYEVFYGNKEIKAKETKEKANKEKRQKAKKKTNKRKKGITKEKAKHYNNTYLSSSTRTLYTVNNLYRPYQGGSCSGK